MRVKTTMKVSEPTFISLNNFNADFSSHCFCFDRIQFVGWRRRTNCKASVKCQWIQLSTLWFQQSIAYRHDWMYEKPQNWIRPPMRTVSIIFLGQQSIRDARNALPSKWGLRWRQWLEWSRSVKSCPMPGQDDYYYYAAYTYLKN